ncbi:hypothetical protein STABA_v1c00910 [Spiroplasma tabanidicola]|uniref:Uncharacterized protein n=1 Tax=Spiroplasma tabanidicola TaxID=324079 RepID=A0A6I6CBA6_9MOLU|nr:hypothetical protein [Spiroplasma tabanidicola]QGS51458.1 hypothetical protein STABA_v1c00910 [Spiroplasma tabanidicola]
MASQSFIKKILLVETFDGQLYSNSFSEWMPLIEVQQNSTYKDKNVYDIQKTHKQIKTKSPGKYTNWIF